MVRKLMLVSTVLTAVLVCGGASVRAMEVSIAEALAQSPAPITVILNGHQMELDVPPALINGRTLLPMRAIFEALGVEIEWDGATKTVTGVGGSVTVQITIGSSSMVRNGSEVSLDSPAVIINGSTLVPARAIVESFDSQISWDEETRTVYIDTADHNPEAPTGIDEQEETGIPEDYGAQEERFTPGDAVE